MADVKKNEEFWRRFSLSRVLFWIVVMILAYRFGWLASVTFVALCSLYANIASDFAAWRADVSPHHEQIERIEEMLQELLDKK